MARVLPNGNRVIRARQQAQVNYEVSELRVRGVNRSADIGSDNKYSYENIAQTRIVCGDEGHLCNVQ